MKTLPIGADQLLNELENGATLVSCWKYRPVPTIKPRKWYVVHKPNGELFRVQPSAVKALIDKRAIRPTYAVFGHTEYKLVK